MANVADILRNGDLYRNMDIRPAYTYASLIRQVRCNRMIFSSTAFVLSLVDVYFRLMWYVS